jgi:hypothetical protein
LGTYVRVKVINNAGKLCPTSEYQNNVYPVGLAYILAKAKGIEHNGSAWVYYGDDRMEMSGTLNAANIHKRYFAGGDQVTANEITFLRKIGLTYTFDPATDLCVFYLL